MSGWYGAGLLLWWLLLLLVVQLDGEGDGSPPDAHHVDLGLGVRLRLLHALHRMIGKDRPDVVESTFSFQCYYVK